MFKSQHNFFNLMKRKGSEGFTESLHIEGVARFQDKKPVSRAVLSATSSSHWEGVTAVSQQERGTASGFPRHDSAWHCRDVPLKTVLTFLVVCKLLSAVPPSYFIQGKQWP